MKHIHTQIKKISTKAIFVALLIVGMTITPAGLAIASTYGSNFGDAGFDFGSDWETIGSYTDYSPVYGYSDYSPSYGYSDYSPSYGYSDYTPSYSSYGYDYTPSYSNYSTPSYYSGTGYTPYYSNYGSSYRPSPSYSYIPAGSSGGSNAGSYASSPNQVYVSSSNTNNNTNNNTASASNNNNITANPTNTNIFNPVNNNDARINLVVLGGSGSNPTPTNNLSVNCTINPSVTYVNQNVVLSANATGGNGNYTYSWTGTDGLSSTGQSFTGMFSYAGIKTATVTVYSNGQTASASCTTNVQSGNVINYQTGIAYCVANPTNGVVGQPVTWTAYLNSNQYNGAYTYSWSGSEGLYGNGQTISRAYNTPGYQTANVTMYGNGQTYTATCSTNIVGYAAGVANGATVIRDVVTNGTPVSGVYLNQVPATGISIGLKVTLFAIGLILWSLFAAYIISIKRKGKVLATSNGASADMSSRIEAFKAANLQKRG